jgi:hypothetical protein
MLHPQPFTIASVAKTLDDLKKLPRDEQATALLRRLLHLYPQVRGSGGLHKGSLLLPNDPYSLATGFDISENMPVRLYLLGTPWNRLVNEGYLIDPNGNGFFSISDDGMEALQKLESMPSITTSLAPSVSESEGRGAPTAFISYSWENAEHKRWVLNLATKLQGEHGVKIILDQWDLYPGKDKALFMETAIAAADFVLVVCTPEYAKKSDHRAGGVGYEAMILTSQLAKQIAQAKFIPVLRSGDWDSSIPIWIQSKIGVDLRGEPYAEDQYELLLRVLHKALQAPPAIAARPSFLQSVASNTQKVEQNAVGAVLSPAKRTGGQPKLAATKLRKKTVKPELLAQFQEENGEIVQIYEEGEELPSIFMDLWIENPPANTEMVYFEITDTGFTGRKWSQRKSKAPRAFLTDDINSWGLGVLSSLPDFRR